MESKTLKKYLGMAVHFVYYHHDNLHKEQTFSEEYWEKLCNISDLDYLNKMYDCLTHAFTLEDYFIDSLNSPNKEHYSKQDIMLFFEKFHAFLKVNLKR